MNTILWALSHFLFCLMISVMVRFRNGYFPQNHQFCHIEAWNSARNSDSSTTNNHLPVIKAYLELWTFAFKLICKILSRNLKIYCCKNLAFENVSWPPHIIFFMFCERRNCRVKSKDDDWIRWYPFIFQQNRD